MNEKTRTAQENTRASAIVLPWILRMRWGAVATQALMAAVIRLSVGLEFPLAPLALLLLFQGGSNFLLAALSRNEKTASAVFTAAMFADVLLFTVVLALTGGPMNPFTFFYLVHVTIGAILMPPAAAGLLSILAIACYAALFLFPDPAPAFQAACHAAASPDPAMLLHLKGMWLAFAVTALAVFFLTGRIRKSLNEHRLALERLKEEKSKNERLASLATLAAGCAHELSTPLATIAVAAAELEEELAELNGGDELREDAGLIREEVHKCKEILSQMSADAGEPAGERLRKVGLADFLAETAARCSLPDGITLETDTEETGVTLVIPEAGMTRVIRALVKNCVDAGASIIKIRGRREDGHAVIEIADNGSGMDEATRNRAAEPFFTTKDAGSGMGLGLYLARTMAERLGGSMELESERGRGTTVLLRLPITSH